MPRSPELEDHALCQSISPTQPTSNGYQLAVGSTYIVVWATSGTGTDIDIRVQ